MTTRLFLGMASALELECSGQSLGADINLLRMMLCSVGRNRVLANFTVKDEVCVTTDVYSSCVEGSGSWRNNKLGLLLFDAAEGQSRIRTGDGSPDIVGDSGSNIMLTTFRIIPHTPLIHESIHDLSFSWPYYRWL